MAKISRDRARVLELERENAQLRAELEQLRSEQQTAKPAPVKKAAAPKSTR